MVSCTELETILRSTEEPYVRSRAILEAIHAVGVFLARREEVGLGFSGRNGDTINVDVLHAELQKLSLGNSLLKITYPALYHGLWIVRRLQPMKNVSLVHEDEAQNLQSVLSGVHYTPKDKLRSAERSVPAWRGFTWKDGFTLNISSFRVNRRRNIAPRVPTFEEIRQNITKILKVHRYVSIKDYDKSGVNRSFVCCNRTVWPPANGHKPTSHICSECSRLAKQPVGYCCKWCFDQHIYALCKGDKDQIAATSARRKAHNTKTYQF